MILDVCNDDFDGVTVHTFARNWRPCWLLDEIERALREEVDDFDTRTEGHDAFEGEDFERLSPDQARPLLQSVGLPPAAEPVVVLYEGGLTLACAGSRVGHAIRRKLLKDAAQTVHRAARIADIARRARDEMKALKRDDRARKMELQEIVQAARLCEALDDDASAAVAVAAIADIATRHALVTQRLPEALAEYMGEENVRPALLALSALLST